MLIRPRATASCRPSTSRCPRFSRRPVRLWRRPGWGGEGGAAGPRGICQRRDRDCLPRESRCPDQGSRKGQRHRAGVEVPGSRMPQGPMAPGAIQSPPYLQTAPPPQAVPKLQTVPPASIQTVPKAPAPGGTEAPDGTAGEYQVRADAGDTASGAEAPDGTVVERSVAADDGDDSAGASEAPDGAAATPTASAVATLTFVRRAPRTGKPCRPDRAVRHRGPEDLLGCEMGHRQSELSDLRGQEAVDHGRAGLAADVEPLPEPALSASSLRRPRATGRARRATGAQTAPPRDGRPHPPEETDCGVRRPGLGQNANRTPAVTLCEVMSRRPSTVS